MLICRSMTAAYIHSDDCTPCNRTNEEIKKSQMLKSLPHFDERLKSVLLR